ncbi:propionyl-CoA synthetase [Rudanella lutea]|uniref:propionyl-CoA synthetase n=1 Tax=Rudanella lutea TaxID=451374 RepID=UPI00035D52CA|nr:propionyl-CoA synthetase [Rudanella lutea]
MLPTSYTTAHERSLNDPAGFWQAEARAIPWVQFPEQILSADAHGYPRWFADGVLNTCYAALDYHVENGRADQTALIYDSPVTGTVRRYSYREMLDKVAQLAGAFRQLGVGPGDTVVIYMPMVPEAAFAMLACARIGAIHSVVFGGFAPHELALRINDAQPKLILSASCGIEFDRVIPYKPLLDEAIRQATHQPDHCLILQRRECTASMEAGRDLDWAQTVAGATPTEPVPVNATDPLYILYTSGTTGKPKGIVRDHGGHAVALRYSLKAVYNVEPGDVFWAASDLGWAVGHSYIVYAPLLGGCTSLLYEGKPVRTPDAGAFWRVIEQHQVNVFFAAPTAFRAIRKEDPDGKLRHRYNLGSLRTIFVAGERCDPPTLHWLEAVSGVPVIDHWWQTESGWPMLSNPMGISPMPVKAGSATVPVCGYDLRILDEAGEPLGPNQEGFVCLKLPLPPGCLPTLWRDPERFRQSYLSRFPGYYLSGDGGYIDEDGYVFIMGRVDDVINVAGHRLSTGEMEELVGSHPAVAECAVVGLACSLRGQRPVGFVVLKDDWGKTPDEALPAAETSRTVEDELVTLIRDQIGAVAYFRQAVIVKRLPKTRSGKILRKTIRQLADGESFAVPSTIDDPVILDEIRAELAARGIGLAFE